MMNQVLRHRVIIIVGLILMTIEVRNIISSFLTDLAMAQLNPVMMGQGQRSNTLPRFGKVHSQISPQHFPYFGPQLI